MIGGTASYSALPFDDYTLDGVGGITGSYVTIPAGQAFKDVTLTAITDIFNEPTESARLSIIPYTISETPYEIGFISSATVDIVYGDPVVSIAATDPNANKTSGDTGTYQITRTGSTSSSLNVKLSIGGTAEYGIVEDDDYTLNPANASVTGNTATITIPAGAQSIDVVLTPENSFTDGGETETATLTIIDYAIGTTPYGIGADSSATVTISGDHPCGDGSDVAVGATCIVIMKITSAISIEVKTQGAIFTTTAESTDDIVEVFKGGVEKEDIGESQLPQEILDAANDALQDATALPLGSLDALVTIMVPGIQTAQVGVESVTLKVFLKATGKKFVWNGTKWTESPFEQEILVAAYSKSNFSKALLSLASLADAKEFVSEVKALFVTAKTDLQTQNIDAKQYVRDHITADQIIFPGEEDE